MRGLTIALLGATAIAALLLARTRASPPRRQLAPMLEAPRATPEKAPPPAAAPPNAPADPTEERRAVPPPPLDPTTVSIARGVFVDSAGAGVPGVRVRLSFARNHSSGYPYHMGQRVLVTDSSGRYATEAPRRAGWYTVRSEPPPGFARPAYREIGAGGRAEARFVLARAAHVTGRVERRDGTPVHGAQLDAEWIGSRAFDCRTRTDADGRFRLHVPEGVRGFTVVAKGYGDFNPFDALDNGEEAGCGDRSLARTRVPGVDPGADLHIVLPGAVDAEIRFLTPDGEPLERGYVKIHEGQDDTCVWEFHCRDSAWRVSALAPVRYRFEFHPEDQSFAPASVSAVLPSAGPIELRCDHGAAVKGRLLGDDTKGFQATWLGRVNRYRADYYAAGARQLGPTTEVVDGRFEFLGLAPHSAALYVHKEGDPRCAYVPDVLPGTESLAIRLEPGHVIRGTVAGFDPARHDAVRAVRGAISVSAGVAADGSFAIVGLPPGRFRVEVLAIPRQRTRFVPKALAVGATTDVEAGAECVRVLAR